MEQENIDIFESIQQKSDDQAKVRNFNKSFIAVTRLYWVMIAGGLLIAFIILLFITNFTLFENWKETSGLGIIFLFVSSIFWILWVYQYSTIECKNDRTLYNLKRTVNKQKEIKWITPEEKWSRKDQGEAFGQVFGLLVVIAIIAAFLYGTYYIVLSILTGTFRIKMIIFGILSILAEDGSLIDFSVGISFLGWIFLIGMLIFPPLRHTLDEFRFKPKKRRTDSN